MSDDQLLKKIEEYKALAKENKDVDVSSLMINALEQNQANRLSASSKRWAYLISIAFPPFGLFFALYFYNSGKDDGKHAAYICTALTVFVVVLIIIFLKAFISTSGIDINQLQQIQPGDIQELLQ